MAGRAKTKREQARVVYVRRVPPELVDQLDALARAEGSTRQDVALRALAAGAEALERETDREGPGDGPWPWCESCQSWHAPPRDHEHKAALGCHA